MEIDREVAVGTHPFACRAAIGRDLDDALAGVVRAGASGEACGVEPEVAPPGLHAGGRSLLDRGATPAERGGVALQIVAGHPAEEFVHRHIQRLALQIPQRQIERAHGVQPLAPWRIVVRTIHVLPDAGDLEGILPDEAARVRRDRIERAAFADAGDADVGIDGHDHAALQQRNLERHHVRPLVEPNARDLRLPGARIPRAEVSRASAGRSAQVPQTLQKRAGRSPTALRRQVSS